MSRGKLRVLMCRDAPEDNNNIPLPETRSSFENNEVAHSSIVDNPQLDFQGFTTPGYNNIPPSSAVTFQFDNNEVLEAQYTSVVDCPQLTSHDFTVLENVEFEVIEMSLSDTAEYHPYKGQLDYSADDLISTFNESCRRQDSSEATTLEGHFSLEQMSCEEQTEGLTENSSPITTTEIAQAQDYVNSLPGTSNEEQIIGEVSPNIKTHDLNLEEISYENDTGMYQPLVPYSETSDSDSSDSSYLKKK